MALLLYLLLVYLSEIVTFSWGWFFLALIFSLRDAKIVYKYKYTKNPDLHGEIIDEDDSDELAAEEETPHDEDGINNLPEDNSEKPESEIGIKRKREPKT